MKKYIILSLIGLVLIVVTSNAFAMKPFRGYKDDSNLSPIMKGLIEKFNLDENKVQEFVNNFRQEQKQKKQESVEKIFAKRLDQALEKGEINEEQKQALIKKHNEIQNTIENLRQSDKKEENFEEIKKIRKEMKDCSEKENIDFKVFGPSGKSGFHGLKHGFRSVKK